MTYDETITLPTIAVEFDTLGALNLGAKPTNVRLAKQNGHDEILKRCSTTPTNGWFAQRPLVVANKLTYVL